LLAYPLLGALVVGFFSAAWTFYRREKTSAGIYIEVPPELREGREISYNIPFLYFARYYPARKDSGSYTLEENSLLRKENITSVITSINPGIKVTAEYALPGNYKYLPGRVVSPTLYLKTLRIYGAEGNREKFLNSLVGKLSRQLFSLLKIKSYLSRVHIQNLLYLRTRIEKKIQELRKTTSFMENLGRKYGNGEVPNLATSVEPYFLPYLSPRTQARAYSIILQELKTDLSTLQKEVEYFSAYSKFYRDLPEVNSCREAEKKAQSLMPAPLLPRLMGELGRDCLLPKVFSVTLPAVQKKPDFKGVLYSFFLSFFLFLALALAWNALKDED